MAAYGEALAVLLMVVPKVSKISFILARARSPSGRSHPDFLPSIGDSGFRLIRSTSASLSQYIHDEIESRVQPKCRYLTYNCFSYILSCEWWISELDSKTGTLKR